MEPKDGVDLTCASILAQAIFVQTVRCFSALPKVISLCDHGPQGVECRGRFVQGIMETDFDGSSSAIHDVASGTAWSSPERASTAEEGEAESFGAAAEKGTHHSGEADESVICPRWFVARGASVARKPRVGKGRGHFSRTNPCISRRSSFGSSREDCEARGGDHSFGTRRFTGEISVGGSFAEGQEGSQDDTSGREARFLFAICREGFEEAPVVRSGSCSSAPEEIPGSRTNLPKHGKIWRFCATRHPKQQLHLLRFRMPAEKWSNSERRFQS